MVLDLSCVREFDCSLRSGFRIVHLRSIPDLRRQRVFIFTALTGWAVHSPTPLPCLPLTRALSRVCP